MVVYKLNGQGFNFKNMNTIKEEEIILSNLYDKAYRRGIFIGIIMAIIAISVITLIFLLWN